MTDELNPTQFRMQTNIKQKPGSQGTLFQGGYNRNYHRGYGPERRAAIQKTADFNGATIPRIGTRGDESERISRVVDNIARSTIPVRHLGNDDEGRPLQIKTAAPTGWNVRGDYHRRGESGFGFPLIRLTRGVENSTTVIHEIGHHVSQLQGNDHALQYIDPANRGREEAFADNYAQEHWRDRRGKSTTVPAYGGGQVTENRPAQFYSAYRAGRDAAQPYRQPRDHEYNPHADLPPEHVPGQEPLLDKVITHTAKWTGNDLQSIPKADWDYRSELGHKRRDDMDPPDKLGELLALGESLLAKKRK